MKKGVTFIIFLAAVIINLSLFQVVVSNRLSTTGVTLGKLQDEIKKYETENLILQEELLISSSFHSIASQAAGMGFSENKKQIVLSDIVPVAIKR